MIQEQIDLQICDARYYAANVKVEAKLYARCEGIGLRYVIMLIQEHERAECDLGSDVDAARQLFLRVVYGGVTVCTLHDIVEDYRGTLF